MLVFFKIVFINDEKVLVIKVEGDKDVNEFLNGMVSNVNDIDFFYVLFFCFC